MGGVLATCPPLPEPPPWSPAKGNQANPAINSCRDQRGSSGGMVPSGKRGSSPPHTPCPEIKQLLQLQRAARARGGCHRPRVSCWGGTCGPNRLWSWSWPTGRLVGWWQGLHLVPLLSPCAGEAEGQRCRNRAACSQRVPAGSPQCSRGGNAMASTALSPSFGCLPSPRAQAGLAMAGVPPPPLVFRAPQAPRDATCPRVCCSREVQYFKHKTEID